MGRRGRKNKGFKPFLQEPKPQQKPVKGTTQIPSKETGSVEAVDKVGVLEMGVDIKGPEGALSNSMRVRLSNAKPEGTINHNGPNVALSNIGSEVLLSNIATTGHVINGAPPSKGERKRRLVKGGGGGNSCEDTSEKDRCIERLMTTLQAPRTDESKGKYIERLVNSINDLMKLEGETFDLNRELEKSKKLEDEIKEFDRVLKTEPVKKDEMIEQICAFCDHHTGTRCTGCRLVFYCNRDCQKSHWKDHKDICRPYTIARRKEGERLLLASRDLSVGDVILHEAPLVMGPRPGSDPTCITCYKRITESYSCSKCGLLLCSKQCEQGQHSTLECPVLENAGVKSLPEEMFPDRLHDCITILRCLLFRQKEGERWEAATERFNMDLLKLVGSSDNNIDLVAALSNTFKIFSYSNFASLSITDIQEVLGLLQIHNVPSKLPHGEAQGVYTLASLLSHSCLPNTKIIWNEESKKLRVTAAEDIPRGTPLTTTFTDPLWGTRARRDHLQQTRKISCFCKRCKDPTELGTFFSALLCRSCPDKGSILPIDPLSNTSLWKCLKCSKQITSSEVLQETLALGAAVSKVLQAPSVESSEALLKSWTGKVHPNHYHLHALNHSLLQLYGRQQERVDKKNERHWEEIGKKERACKDFLRVCALLDPPLSQTTLYVGVAFFEYHKTIVQTAKRAFGFARINSLQLKKRMLLAKELLRKAMEIFREEPSGSP